MLIVDNSNFWYGLQRRWKVVPDQIKVEVLWSLWGAETKGFVAGSLMCDVARDARYIEKWSKLGLQTCFAPISRKEYFVDDMLHAQILAYICQPATQPKVLHLFTGDGNANHQRTTFPGVVTVALRQGIPCHVWSWKDSRHQAWSQLKITFPDLLTICDVDLYVDKFLYFGDIAKGQTEEERMHLVCMHDCLLTEAYAARAIPWCLRCNKIIFRGQTLGRRPPYFCKCRNR